MSSASQTAPLSAAALPAGTSLWQDAMRRLRRNRMAVFGASVSFVIALSALLGPWLISVAWGYHYETQDLAYGARPPSWSHPFGTDFFGRDLLTRTLAGTQISLAVGLMAATVAASIGTFYGAIAGYLGGKTGGVMMRMVDVVDALPYMFLVIVLVTVFPRSLLLLFIALGAVGWLTTARIVRGQVLGLKERDFVLAAKSLGADASRIVMKHLIPHTFGPIIVYFTLTVPAMILQEAFLSFLGLGVQAPRPSLGTLINEGAQAMAIFWWQLVFPGGLMALLLFSLNFLGDGVRDAFDPRMRGRQ